MQEFGRSPNNTQAYILKHTAECLHRNCLEQRFLTSGPRTPGVRDAH
jgi:hypothetical protein